MLLKDATHLELFVLLQVWHAAQQEFNLVSYWFEFKRIAAENHLSGVQGLKKVTFTCIEHFKNKTV